jgi:hypothetical protein
MRISILVMFVLGSFYCNAQRPVSKNDTLTYGGSSFYVGQKVQLWYGSGQNKDFAFVFMQLKPLKASYSKNTAIIDDIKLGKNSGGKWVAYAKLENLSWLFEKNIAIDIEGAVDNNELKIYKEQ